MASTVLGNRIGGQPLPSTLDTFFLRLPTMLPLISLSGQRASFLRYGGFLVASLGFSRHVGTGGRSLIYEYLEGGDVSHRLQKSRNNVKAPPPMADDVYPPPSVLLFFFFGWWQAGGRLSRVGVGGWEDKANIVTKILREIEGTNG